ncbi:MAG: TIGR02996 domain-containing protein [Planctomycetia bacterium]|nr:TIGR02996 domain-containing protein [Planctomycetia bacterium]
MSDYDALLRAIIDNPADDTVRLVFADWLDEHADTFPMPEFVRARAAFIRDDIAMSQRDAFDPLRLRWEWIEKPHREAEPWVKNSLPAIPDDCKFLREPLFRRGFPWSVVIQAQGYSRPSPPDGDAFPLEQVRFLASGYYGIDILHQVSWRSQLNAIEFDQAPVHNCRLFKLSGLDRLERLHSFTTRSTLAKSANLSLLRCSASSPLSRSQALRWAEPWLKRLCAKEWRPDCASFI